MICVNKPQWWIRFYYLITRVNRFNLNHQSLENLMLLVLLLLYLC